MQIKPAGDEPAIPAAPQLHSLRNHASYDGARSLPTTTWVRSPTVRPTAADQRHTLVYEVVLYYRRNRACTVYRTRDDFAALRRGIMASSSSSSSSSENGADDDDLHGLLREAVAKHGGSCAVEYFLRRRLGDCGGR